MVWVINPENMTNFQPHPKHVAMERIQNQIGLNFKMCYDKKVEVYSLEKLASKIVSLPTTLVQTLQELV